MINRKPSLSLLSTICTLVLFSPGCGKVRPLSSGLGLGAGDQDSPLQTFLSGLSVVSQGLNDAENIAIISGTSNFSENSATAAAQCPSQTSVCTANQRTIEYNACSAGSYNATGIVYLNYNTDQACNESLLGIPSGGSTVIRTTPQLIFTAANGVTTKVSSESFSNYLGAAIAGGETIYFNGPQSFTLNINGLTRVRSTASGNIVFSHSIRTNQPLVVSGSRTTNNRNLGNGSLLIDHNGARYTATLQFFSVGYSGTCCHPDTGKITATYTGSFNSVISMTFKSSPCGSAEVTTVTGGNTATSNVVLPSCE